MQSRRSHSTQTNHTNTVTQHIYKGTEAARRTQLQKHTEISPSVITTTINAAYDLHLKLTAGQSPPTLYFLDSWL